MLALALLLALSATVMSAMKLTASNPAATTTTVMAPPPPPVSYSPEQVAAAKKEACDASDTADKSIIAAQRTSSTLRETGNRLNTILHWATSSLW